MALIPIKIAKSGQIIEVEPGANLMESLLAAGLPVASSCGGDAVCAKCHVKVLEGADQLSKEDSDIKELKELNDVAKTERISCQTQVLGPVTIDTPYW
ncbi:MAG: 2Fe-2S iron-sulfur cluster-binding protein [Bdellovibrionales bacterium]